MGVQRRSQGLQFKSDLSPVTDADRRVEEALTNELARLCPLDSVLGEESSAVDLTAPAKGQVSERRWILDPIDQTRHFIRGNPEFATLICLEERGRSIVAVVSAPALAQRWSAWLGGGAWRNSQRISVSKVARLENAYVAIAGHREWHLEWKWETVAALLSACAYPVGCAGGFLQAMLVAEGLIDAVVEPWGSIWDHVAPSLIVHEAGGLATTLDGRQATGGSLLASNGLVHVDVLRRLTRRGDIADRCGRMSK